MDDTNDIVTKHKEKINQLARELAEELLKTEPNLIKRFKSFDADVHKILMEVGNNTMQIVGSTLADEIKKKSRKKD